MPDPSLFLSPVPPPTRGSPADHGPDERGERDERDDRGGGSSPPPGADPPPGRDRRRRGLAAAAALVALLAVGALVAGQVTGDGSPGAREGAATGTSTPRRELRAERPTTTTTTTVPQALTTAARLGPLLPEPSGTTVVLASPEQLVVAHLDTGTVRVVAVEGLDVYGGYPFQTVLTVGDRLLTAGQRPSLVPREAGGAVEPVDAPVYGGYLPSAVDGRFWTIDHRFDVELVERALDGPTGRRLTLPGESNAILPFGDGFVISPFGSVLHVDAATGRAERLTDGTAVAIDERTLARIRCDAALDCGLVLSDHDGSNERPVAPPTPRSRYETYRGVEFSPDGRWLVAPFYGEDQPGGLVIIDVATGRRQPADSLAAVSAGGFPLHADFSADGRWLLVADPSADGLPLRAVRLEDGSTTRIDLGVRNRARRDAGTVLLAFPEVPADAEPEG